MHLLVQQPLIGGRRTDQRCLILKAVVTAILLFTAIIFLVSMLLKEKAAEEKERAESEKNDASSK